MPLSARSHPRYRVQKIASYQYGGKQFLTLTQDLGLGGMKINTHDYLPENEHLSFNLVLRESSIRFKGRIAYSNLPPDGGGVSGIQFTEVTEEDYTSLQTYLASLEEWPKTQGMLSAGERAGARIGSRKTTEK